MGCGDGSTVVEEIGYRVRNGIPVLFVTYVSSKGPKTLWGDAAYMWIMCRIAKRRKRLILAKAKMLPLSLGPFSRQKHVVEVLEAIAKTIGGRVRVEV